VLAGCGGGGDPLPAPGPDLPAGAVLVTEVSGATADGAAWFTQNQAVTVHGRAPGDAQVEAFPAGSDRLAAATGADASGDFELPLSLRASSNVFRLRAVAPGASPGPTTELRIIRRTTPPSPFQVGQLPSPTGASSVLVQVTTESDIKVIVRVTGGAADAEGTKPAGVATFSLTVPLKLDQENRLRITGRDLAGNETNPVEREVVQDSSAPAGPEVDPVTRPVNTQTLVLQGRAQGAARVEVTNLSPARSAEVGADGRFAVTVPLGREGANTFDLVAVDRVGHRSPATRVTVTRDTTRPAAPHNLRVSGRPVAANGSVGVNDPSLVIEGLAEPGATVTASSEGRTGSAIAASDSGAFSVTIALPDADAAYGVDIWATDVAGNQGATVRFTVVLDRSAPPPPTLETPPSPVAASSTTLRGEARDAVRVEVTRTQDGQTWRGPVSDGGFEVEVGLNEGENHFQVVAFDAAGNPSPPAEVDVIRDTEDPPPPSVQEDPSRRTGDAATLHGRAPEAARVEMTRRPSGQAETLTPEPNGEFEVTVSLQVGWNEFSFVSVDAAGNQSAAIEVVVVRLPPPPPDDDEDDEDEKDEKDDEGKDEASPRPDAAGLSVA
jgi:hypothetical protein